MHKALIDGGYRAGWGVYALVAPTSSTMPYNYATVDFFDRYTQVPMADTFTAVHPDKDIEEVFEATTAARDHTTAYTMSLVTATEAAPTTD